MIEVRRLVGVGALLALAAIVTCSHVLGEPGRDQKKDLEWRLGGARQVEDIDPRFGEDRTKSRFTDKPLTLYQHSNGDTYIALQVKTELPKTAARPRDYLVLIDTSASKASGGLNQSIKIAEGLAAKLGNQDRLALWTVNTKSHNLTAGFKSASSLAEGFKALAKEYASGAANLKQALTDAVKSFPNGDGRQRVLLFLGDGKSIAGPIDGSDRTSLSTEMVQNEIAFFSVPVGINFEPANLHGFPNATGGKVVRLQGFDNAAELMPRLLEAFDTPILYPRTFQLPAEVIEAFPSKLPPLRGDTSTLVVGKIKAGKKFDFRITGMLAGKETQVQKSLPVPEPEVENFFLVSIVKQWRDAKDRPALIQADRALAFAFEQNHLARADLLAKGEWALQQDKLDPAWRLFKQAKELDPDNAEAQNGMDLVDKLRTGKITRQQLREQMDARDKDLVVSLGPTGRSKRLRADMLDPERPRDASAPVDPPVDVLAEVRARQAVADQQANQMVDEAIQRSNRLVRSVPDEAHEALKRNLDGIRNNPDISDRARVSLSERLERSLMAIDRVGARIKRDQAEQLVLRAAADERLNRERLTESNDERIRRRLNQFHNLMNQARYEEATNLAHDIRTDIIAQGREPPQAVSAAYQMGLNAFHLQEITELKRRREANFLATMLEVEKSHVPFPDEPPVVFPPAAKWRKLTERRKAKYESTGFGGDLPPATLRLQEELSKVIRFGGFDDPKTTLGEALDQLAKRYHVAFDVYEAAFKAEMIPEVLKTEIAQPPIPEMTATLATVVKKLLARIPVGSHATYIIRGDTIEITTGQVAQSEKAVRVYPVADLVIPIPSPGQFVQQNLQNQTGVLGVPGMGMVGMAGMMGMMGMGGGMMGMMGMGGGMMGMPMGGMGGFNMGGMGGFNMGGMGGFNIGGMGGAGGFNALGMAGMANQIGVGGGQFNGQFQGNFNGPQGNNNFAGGFGLQNNNQNRVLITLIRQVIAPKTWSAPYNPITGLPIDPLQMGNDPSAAGGVDPNSIGFYPPAQALVVSAPTRIYVNDSTRPVLGGAGPGAGMGALERDRRGGEFVRIGGNAPPLAFRAPKDGPKVDPKAPRLDPRAVWEDALTKGPSSPGLIIAVADFLAMNQEWEHATEFLKANLRKGIVVKPWVFESLALALRESGGSPEEIERAEVSAAELEPMDSQGFQRAAQAMAGQKRFDRAVAFSRQAALLQPNAPLSYSEGLIYAELAQDSQGMEWAAGSLLKQDWPYKNDEFQKKAVQKLESLARTLNKTNRKDEAERLLENVHNQRQRDLVIKMVYQGEADLDLKVKEPCGSVCSALNRQTVGGGIFIGDSLSEMNQETYLAAQAFPGEYEITVERVWGQPLGNRAQLKIIRHQGTPQQETELVTVELQSNKPIKIRLADGRRTETAYVAPPSALQTDDPAPPVETTSNVLTELRKLADPEITGVNRGVRGGTYTNGMPKTSSVADKSKEPSGSLNDRVLFQNKVDQVMGNGVDVTAQAVLSADRRSIKLSMTPVFGTAGRSTQPTITSPLIPGSP